MQLLKNSFLPHRFDTEILDQIKISRQLPDENVSMFIAKVENLYQRLNQVPQEVNRVADIREHLLPFFITQTAHQEFRTIRELDEVCVKLEKSRICAERAEQGITNSRRNRFQNFVCNNDVNIPSVRTSRATFKCYNCNKVGHRFRECRAPRKLFCFKCGHPGTTSKDCPKCSKNVGGGVKKQGASHVPH